MNKNNNNESSYSIGSSSGVIAINNDSANSTPVDSGEQINSQLLILSQSDTEGRVYNSFRNENDVNCKRVQYEKVSHMRYVTDESDQSRSRDTCRSSCFQH